MDRERSPTENQSQNGRDSHRDESNESNSNNNHDSSNSNNENSNSNDSNSNWVVVRGTSSSATSTSHASRTKGKYGNDFAVKCVSCMDDIKADDALKLTCQSSHSICGECSAVFCESVMTEGYAAVVPHPKCSQCRGPIPVLQFECCLKPGQLSTYLTYVTMQTLDDDEQLLSCVNCPYSEIHTDDPPLFFCQSPTCQTVHCLGCKFKFPPLSKEHDDDDDFYKGQKLRKKHLLCHALREEKAEFDMAMVAGNGMPCPGCKVSGRKGGMECTHMSCSGCGTDWCYLCGLSVDDCDKAPRTGEAATEPIYGHNEEWEVNPLRCPMYITMIGQVDDDWKLEEEAMDSDDEYDEDVLEEQCLNKFHRWKTLHLLKVSCYK
jgi:hypothetical protein